MQECLESKSGPAVRRFFAMPTRRGAARPRSSEKRKVGAALRFHDKTVSPLSSGLGVVWPPAGVQAGERRRDGLSPSLEFVEVSVECFQKIAGRRGLLITLSETGETVRKSFSGWLIAMASKQACS